MRSDHAQLQVDEYVLGHLRQLNPSKDCEESDTNGRTVQ